MPTLFSPEVPPCTLVLLIVCRRKSPLWLPQPSRSRSSLHLRGNTPSGSEVPSLPLFPPSNRCGSPSRNTTNQVPESSTASASKSQILVAPRHTLFIFIRIISVIHIHEFHRLDQATPSRFLFARTRVRRSFKEYTNEKVHTAREGKRPLQEVFFYCRCYLEINSSAFIHTFIRLYCTL